MCVGGLQRERTAERKRYICSPKKRFLFKRVLILPAAGRDVSEGITEERLVRQGVADS